MRENNLLLKNPVLDIADPSVPDFLIDAVRCWIGEIGVEATESLSGVEHALGEGGDAGSCIAAPP
jgi:hypothetical protein